MAPVEQNVTFPGKATPELGGFMAHPDGSGPFPGIIVIHEAYGLNDNMRSIARRFSDQGYAALAVDLFAGRNMLLCMVRFFYGMMTSSADNAPIRDLKASLDYFGEQPFVDKNRLGAIGFCMGGGLAIAWACADQRLKAIAPYYGTNPRPLEMTARSCPVVGSYPEQDFTAGAGKKLDEMLTTHNVKHDIKIYPGAHHSFFNDQGSHYNAEAAQDSWGRVMSFFQVNIG